VPERLEREDQQRFAREALKRSGKNLAVLLEGKGALEA
jgi:hypothetical protein